MHKISNEKAETIWSFLEQSGIMNLDTGELSELIEMTKQQKLEKAILKEHIENFYHIWQNDKGVYLTIFRQKTSPRAEKPYLLPHRSVWNERS